MYVGMRRARIRPTVLWSLMALFAFLTLHYSGSLSRPKKVGPSPILALRRDRIRAAFQHSWDGYSRHCFGHDSIRPVSNTCADDFGGYGATAIDALSTAIVLGNEEVVVQILNHIAQLDFKAVEQGTTIQLSEITTGHLGAMISAWDLLNGPFQSMVPDNHLRKALYRTMVELGEILSSAFDTPTGIPVNWVDPVKRKGVEGDTTTIAGIGTTILEFSRLSDITRKPKYAQMARKAEAYLLSPEPASGEPYPGLLGSSVSIETGELLNANGSWGASSNVFYEYLLKAYMYDSRTYAPYLDRWLLAADSTIRYIGSHPHGHSKLTLLPSWNAEGLQNRMDSLSWFAGGNFILGGMVTGNNTLVKYGVTIANAAGAIYDMTKTGLGAEAITWETNCDGGTGRPCDASNSVDIPDARFSLRPEVLETWYYAYRATKNRKYRRWSWETWEAINKYCKTDSGFSALKNVNQPNGGEKTDEQGSFVLSKVMKYVFMTQLDNETIQHQIHDSRKGAKTKWVFNTEGHPLRVAGRPL